MGADLVVLGTHGRAGLEHLFLGSVAEKLIRRLPCPVLTVSHEEGRTWAAPGLITRILCATDFSPSSAEALRLARMIAEKHGAEITLLHAIENAPDFGDNAYRSLLDVEALCKELVRRTEERLRGVVEELGAGPRVDIKAVVGCAYKEVLRIAAADRADLIVIGAQGHGFLEHLLSGSNAQHIIRRSTCPVLTVRPVRTAPPVHDPRMVGLKPVSPPHE
jgi:nucleotide-binding universal stress UspA family protein